MDDFGFVPQLKKASDGALWKAIIKYDSTQISVKALSEFDSIVTGMSTYNIPDLLNIWDSYHQHANGN